MEGRRDGGTERRKDGEMERRKDGEMETSIQTVFLREIGQHIHVQ